MINYADKHTKAECIKIQSASVHSNLRTPIRLIKILASTDPLDLRQIDGIR